MSNSKEIPKPPPLPEIPVAKFKVGDIVPNWYVNPHIVLGIRLQLTPNAESDTIWDGIPTWEYNLWKWSKWNSIYSYSEWGWVKELEILKLWNEFQTQENQSCVEMVQLSSKSS